MLVLYFQTELLIILFISGTMWKLMQLLLGFNQICFMLMNTFSFRSMSNVDYPHCVLHF